MAKYDLDLSDEECPDYTEAFTDGSDDEEEGSLLSFSSSGENKRSGGQTLAPVKNSTTLEALSGIVAAASVATSVGAMILSPVNVVYAAGGLSCFIGPYAFFQQRRLTDVIALQETHNALSAEIDRLASENDRLHNAVADLSKTVDRLEDCEQALDTITSMQGQSIKALEEQVQDNREILSQMESNLKANVLQNLLQLVIRSDKDGDSMIDEREIESLIKRIEKTQGVLVRKDRFIHVIQEGGGSLQCIMDIIKNLMNDRLSEDNDIFMFDVSD